LAESDAELMRRVQAGNAEALERLMERHGRLLRVHLERYVDASTAQDLQQELWLRVWQRAEQWEGRGSVVGWLLAIATNLALNALRSRRRADSLDALMEDEEWEAAASLFEASTPAPEDEAIWRERLERVMALIDQMPGDKQTVLRLARLQEKTLPQIAAQLGIPVGTVKSRLHHAMRWLAEHMEDEL
jgi:RNA polymerase sigma-70 factor (ECF subfamily)